MRLSPAFLLSIVLLASCARQAPVADPGADIPPLAAVPAAREQATSDNSGAETPAHVQLALADPPHGPVGPQANPGSADPPSDADAAVPSAVIQPFEHIRVHLQDRLVEVDATVCLTVGWLEQVVCIPGTREHEALMVTEALPSHIHASLLLIGLEPGTPGRWSYEGNEVSVTAPTGASVDVWVRYEGDDGQVVEQSARKWIRDQRGEVEFPSDPWVFAGSFFADQPEQLGGGQVYVADISGSVLGLVTFGDEVIAFGSVLADEEAVSAPQWEADTDVVPAIGTKVTLVFKPLRPTSPD